MKNFIMPWVIVAVCLGLLPLAIQAQSPTLDPAFLLTSATGRPPNYGPVIGDLLLQPDGKLVVAGDFVALNGRPAINVTRLLPDGQVDTTFAAPPVDGEVVSLALQADGKLLIGGPFTTVGGQSRIGIARLLPDGTLDPAFRSPFGGGPLPLNAYSNVEKIVLQPGRGILVLGLMIPVNPAFGRGFYAARLLEATGALDPAFQPGFSTFGTRDALVLPSGHLVFAGEPHLLNGQQCNVWGTLPDGALDTAFVPLPSPTPAASVPLAYGLVRDPATGNIYVVLGPGLSLVSEPVRLLPNGVRDPTFSTAGVFSGSAVGGVRSVAVQPNGRLLLGGPIPTAGGFFGSARLLPGGALDSSYGPNWGPGSGVLKVLVQPDGKLLFAGAFTGAAGFALNCLARMLDPNVLGARARAEAPDLAVWPVPARDVLHLRLSNAGGGPCHVALLDALGRVVRAQDVAAGQGTPTLPTAGLPPGAYLLRVAFATGPPAYRRVVVE